MKASSLGGVTQQYDVTSVGVNPTKDRSYRMRMYFLTMSVRVLCVISLFWVRGWWVILVGIGAVVLPYVAVLIANAVSHVGGVAPDAPSPLELQGAPYVDSEDERGAADGASAAGAIIVIDAPAERRTSGAPNGFSSTAPRDAAGDDASGVA